MSEPFLQIADLRFSYPSGRPVLDGINLQLHRGEVVALVGPNGSGKTSLLHLALGLWKPNHGSIHWAGKPLSHWSRRALARQVTLVEQKVGGTFDFSVRDIVAMGRFAYRGRFDPEHADDTAAIDDALRRTELIDLQDRPYPKLSGGEQQRVQLARAFAQSTIGLLLDEPISSLDLRQQWHFLELVREHAQQGGAVLMAVHDLSLAAHFADRLVILHQGRLEVDGPPDEVLTPEMLENVFGMACQIVHEPGSHRQLIVPTHRVKMPLDEH